MSTETLPSFFAVALACFVSGLTQAPTAMTKPFMV